MTKDINTKLPPKDPYLVYAITDRSWLGDKPLTQALEEALQGGASMVQVREKDLDGDQFEKEARELLKICRAYGVPMLVNDRVDIAKKIGADGVHLGQEDMPISKAREILGPDAIIGGTAKTVAQAQEAEREGASYLGSGAVFGSKSKRDAKAISLDRLDDICGAVSIPVVAIGGVNKENIDRLAGTGVAGVAVIEGIFGEEDIEGAARTLKEKAGQYFRQEEKMKVALTIAGSDSSGGAGIQADIKTMTVHKVFAMSAVTALTAQNTQGVVDIMNASPEFLAEELDAVFTDIFPDAVKIGMVSSADLVKVIASKLQEYKAKNIVVDPVMVATSGAHLIDREAEEELKSLLSLADLITPNIPEAEVLTGMEIKNEGDMEEAGRALYQTFFSPALVKGGHGVKDANDFLFDGKEGTWFKAKRVNNPNTHGTGCTLSSAIASNLAKGKGLKQSVAEAKHFVSLTMASMLDLGHGSGPLDHLFAIDGNYPIQ